MYFQSMLSKCLSGYRTVLLRTEKWPYFKPDQIFSGTYSQISYSIPDILIATITTTTKCLKLPRMLKLWSFIAIRAVQTAANFPLKSIILGCVKHTQSLNKE